MESCGIVGIITVIKFSVNNKPNLLKIMTTLIGIDWLDLIKKSIQQSDKVILYLNKIVLV